MIHMHQVQYRNDQFSPEKFLGELAKLIPEKDSNGRVTDPKRLQVPPPPHLPTSLPPHDLSSARPPPQLVSGATWPRSIC